MRPLALAILASLALAAPAAAQQATVDRAVRCLEHRPVCVDRAAQDSLPSDDARDLTEQIVTSGDPIFVAVLPEPVLGGASSTEEVDARMRAILGEMKRGVQRQATYALVVDNHFRSHSDLVQSGPLAAAAARSGSDAHSVLSDFVTRVDDASAFGDATIKTDDGGGDYSVNPLIPIAIVGGLLLLMFGLIAHGRRDRRRREAAQLEAVKRHARDDLVALGDDIRSLDLDIEMPNASAEAKEDYGRAVDLYKRAQDAFDTAQRPQDLAPVASTVEEGRYLVASARARLEGREPPEHRPPCFFDPRHGPSVRDVEWAPPGGAPRAVPACEADAQRVESGLDPNVREVQVAGQSVPYWNAPAYYGPWAGGFFGGFGGGLLVGSLFTGGFGWGGGFVDSAWGSEGDWGGGDGGGDFGGGDFGGGDFGGGDFGGGDFGGGDF